MYLMSIFRPLFYQVLGIRLQKKKRNLYLLLRFLRLIPYFDEEDPKRFDYTDFTENEINTFAILYI